MKWNCFDWFDHYAAEKNGVPKLETQPIHTDTIWKRVQEQAGIAPQPKRNRMHMTKWMAGIAAAAVLVTGGTTLVAAAGYGGLDAFFQSLIGEETPKDPEKLAALVGKYYELEGQRVLLISGAIQAKGTVQEGGTDLLGTVKLGADAKRKAVDVDDEDSFLVKFKSGAVGSIEATRNAWGRNNFITVELHGTLGSLYFNYERLNELQVCLAGDPDDRRGFKTIYTGPAHFHGEVTWNIPGMNIGYGELKSIESYEFIKAVVEGRQPSTSFAEGYRVERVSDAVKRSAETGRWVTVND